MTFPALVLQFFFFCVLSLQVCVGSGEYVHLRIFRSLSQEVELSAFQLGKTLEDKLEYF